MALITPGRASQRPPYFKRILSMVIRQGQLYVKAFPRKRKTAKQVWQIANQERFKIASQAIKHIHEREQSTMQTGLDEFLAENRGVKGTAAIRLRDWFTAVMFGRAWAVRAPNNRIYYPATVLQDISDLLDSFDPRVGSLLVRTNATWLPTVQCQEKFILCLLPEGDLPDTCPVASIPTNKDESVGGF